MLNAITPNDLANSQVSPFEATLPKVLREAGYKSALFGKFHLGGPQNNPFRNATPLALGWDYFYGFLEGAPHPIDTTAGLGPSGSQGNYPCGFVPNSSGTDGADSGACYAANNSCTNLSATPDQPIPGLSCLESGGIFVPSQACQSTPPANVNFSTLNAYYVSPLFIEKRPDSVDAVPATDIRARTYRSILESDAVIKWIKEQRPNQSWMATLAYSAIHSPYQPPPASLLPAGSADPNNFDCIGNHISGLIYERILSNQMLEAMDNQIGRVMVETGLATTNTDGSLNYQPEKTNTMVVIIGDNGTYAPGVKAPFDPSRSKAYVYQTGVWVPLIIAGPIVKSPDRDVESQINVADLFQLFGDIGGVDVHDVVPSSHILDSLPMLAYLKNPAQPSIRKENFTQSAYNLTANGVLNQPCIVVVAGAPICTQIVPSQAICTIEGGDWWGTGSPFQETNSCCEVQASPLYAQQYGTQPLTFYPDAQAAMRNDNFKVVQIRRLDDCTIPTQPKETITNEFYEINQDAPIPMLDKEGDSLCAASGCPAGLTPEQTQIYNKLFADMQAELNSEPQCPGDGNLDKVVNFRDIDLWTFFSIISRGDGSAQAPSSSWYDLNLDGLTDFNDLNIILQHLGDRCIPRDDEHHSRDKDGDDSGH